MVFLKWYTRNQCDITKNSQLASSTRFGSTVSASGPIVLSSAPVSFYDIILKCLWRSVANNNGRTLNAADNTFMP